VNSGYAFPLKRITVNLAPADVRKDGSAFDLPIALGILGATGQLNGQPPRDLSTIAGEHLSIELAAPEQTQCDVPALQDYLVVGELNLEGGLRPVRGALPVAIAAKRAGFKGVVVPVENLAEAGVVQGLDVVGARSLEEVGAFIEGRGDLERAQVDLRGLFSTDPRAVVDLSEVRGQEHAKRALEVAAAGAHNLLKLYT
jgi:magnesium chelatase family protein